MAMQRNTMVGVFSSHDQARNTISDLRQLGLRGDQIGIAGRDWRTGDAGSDVDELDESYAGEGAAAGAAAGAGAGALWGLGVLAGAMPAIGPAIAGGTLAVLLSSAAAGAAATGVVGALVGLGIPKNEAEFYESEFHAGRYIVSVNAPGRELEVAEVFRRHGGYDHATQPELIGHGSGN